MACIRRRAGFAARWLIWAVLSVGWRWDRQLASESSARAARQEHGKPALLRAAGRPPAARRETGRQSKVASGCCRPWSMRMVSPGDLTCGRALGDIGQMSGMAATTQTALPRIGVHDPKSIGHRHRSGLAAGGKSRPVGAQRVGAPGKERGLTLVTPARSGEEEQPKR
jgi:hypothetical protein